MSLSEWVLCTFWYAHESADTSVEPGLAESRREHLVWEVTGRFGSIPVRTPGRFGPIPFRSGRFGLGRFGPIYEVGRFGPILVGRFGPLYFI